MTDSEEIAKLKEKIKKLKKQLEENKKADEERHNEIKEIQQKQHKENLIWNKIGALSVPLTIILSLVAYFFKKGEKGEKDDELLKTEKTW